MSADVVLVSVTVNSSGSPLGRSGAGLSAATVASIPPTDPVVARDSGAGDSEDDELDDGLDEVTGVDDVTAVEDGAADTEDVVAADTAEPDVVAV